MKKFFLAGMSVATAVALTACSDANKPQAVDEFEKKSGTTVEQIESDAKKNAGANASMLEQLKALSDSVNKTLPMMVDSETRLERTSTGPGLALSYHYTLPNVSGNEVDMNVQFSNLKGKVCSSMRAMIENGIKVTYIYNDKANAEVGRHTYSKADCP